MFTMKYVTVREMKELDSRAINQHGIPAAVLMENAGKAVSVEAMKMVEAGDKRGVFIFCGYGNNGGDGFVTARRLLLNGYQATTFLAGKPRPFSPEAQGNYQALSGMNRAPLIVSASAEIDRMFDGLPAPGLVIDAVFGIGLRGVPDEFFLKLIGRINGFNCPVIAVDIPSGLDANTGKSLGAAVRAVKTVTLGYPKIGFQNPDAEQYTGEIIVADIGLPACHL